MMITDFIAAIELGSATVKGIVGRLNADKSVQVFATAEVNSVECIKKGIIFNLDKTTQCINSVIQELERQMGTDISKVYVGIGGRSLRSIKVTEEHELPSDTKISQALIDTLAAKNKDSIVPELEILWTEAQEYKVGNNLLTEPVGVQADKLTATFINLVARRSLKANIVSCMKQLPYEIADFYISPLATAESLLTISEKRSGCALVDFGAETTTVLVYNGNILRHLAVIPLGSRNLTKDIMSHKIDEADAETLKIKYGSAYTPLSEDAEYGRREYDLDNGVRIKVLTLEETIEARINEILNNVDNQLLLSGHKDKLLGGVILTGGGANLTDLAVAFERITKISKVRVALSGEVGGSDGVPENGSYNTLLGALLLGKINCKKIVIGKDIFDDAEEQQKRVDEMRQRALKAEQERKQKEAEEALKKAQEEEQRKNKEFAAEIDAVREQIDKGNLKTAVSKLEKLQRNATPQQKEEIVQLAKEVKEAKKKKPHWTSKLFEKFEQGLSKLMGDTDEIESNNNNK